MAELICIRGEVALLPCPFCGKAAEKRAVNLIVCSDVVDCGAEINSGDSGPRTWEFTLRAWNRRAGEVALVDETTGGT